MKRILSGFLLVSLLAVIIYAAQSTTTRSKEREEGHYRTAKNTFTATTALDSVIILNKDSVPVETSEMVANRTIFTLQFITDQTTASKSDWDVLWQVSAVQSGLLPVVFPGETGQYDWVTVETDQNDNSLSWIATFDAAAYKGTRVRAILAEADDSTDEADVIEAYLTYSVN